MSPSRRSLKKVPCHLDLIEQEKKQNHKSWDKLCDNL